MLPYAHCLATSHCPSRPVFSKRELNQKLLSRALFSSLTPWADLTMATLVDDPMDVLVPRKRGPISCSGETVTYLTCIERCNLFYGRASYVADGEQMAFVCDVFI